VNILFNSYGDESDPGPMPVPANANIEGYPNPGTGDRHVLVLDNSNCWLYELYGASVNTNGTWNAGSAAVWDLQNYNERPLTWTSADAAGLPIFPGLIRYDEAASGQIAHAIRFTLQHSIAAYVLPATHWASNSTAQFAAPMGMRLRLKSGFDISSFSATNQVILTALKQYGMIMADNGSSMYIRGLRMIAGATTISTISLRSPRRTLKLSLSERSTLRQTFRRAPPRPSPASQVVRATLFRRELPSLSRGRPLALPTTSSRRKLALCVARLQS
jgi:hypothetical protein